MNSENNPEIERETAPDSDCEAEREREPDGDAEIERETKSASDSTPEAENKTEATAPAPRKNKVGQIILSVIGIILLLMFLAVFAVVVTTLVRFHKSSYEYIPPEERTDEYVMPEYPSVEIKDDVVWDPDNDPEIETEADVSEPEPETEPIETEPATEPETDAETEPTTAPGLSLEPPETIPQVVNPTPSQQQQTVVLNPNASFGNSQNTVSVYGKTPIYKVAQKDPDIVNILLLGTDSRDVTRDRGRSDTMIIVSYNSKTGDVKLTSLLRDSLVPIEGVGWNKLNSAYFYGGVGLAINTINQIYNLDIQQFIVIDFNGVKNFIDYIGGVDLTFTQAELDLYNQYWCTDYTAGTYHCNSKMAMAHLQNRTVGSDFDRTRRQRETIEAVCNQILQNKSATEIYDIVNYTFGLIKTNISATDLISYATSVLGNMSKLNISAQNVPYNDAYTNAWYNNAAILSFDISAAAVRINNFIYN